MNENQFDPKILSSSHINFLFGAGVNGRAFPQMRSFEKSVSMLNKMLGRQAENFEIGINMLKSQTKKKKVMECFANEFKEFSSKLDYENESINNIKKMFIQINRLAEESENRTKTTKQINVYTLNYDEIIENILSQLGYLNNSVSSSNLANHDKFFYMVGYNFYLNKYVPTYLISKLHGGIDNPVFPGNDKYDDMMQANRFEILFKMKEKLSRDNSLLIVIGYSGHDEHINKILKDCVDSGLTIYWFKYSVNDYIPEDLKSKIFIIENEKKTDTTLCCAEMVEQLWVKSLEE